jgi:hypothetical protein
MFLCELWYWPVLTLSGLLGKRRWPNWGIGTVAGPSGTDGSLGGCGRLPVRPMSRRRAQLRHQAGSGPNLQIGQPQQMLGMAQRLPIVRELEFRWRSQHASAVRDRVDSVPIHARLGHRGGIHSIVICTGRGLPPGRLLRAGKMVGPSRNEWLGQGRHRGGAGGRRLCCISHFGGTEIDRHQSGIEAVSAGRLPSIFPSSGRLHIVNFAPVDRESAEPPHAVRSPPPPGRQDSLTHSGGWKVGNR